MNTDEKKLKAKTLILTLLNDSKTDAEDNRLMSELEKIVPDPDITKYIFWSEEFYDEDENLDIDRLLEKAFDYKPNVIAL